MILKSFIVAIILFVSYTLFIQWKNIGQPQNMWQENMVKMQNFIYHDDANIILLGSSLSTGILTSNKEFYNLAAGGGNPFCGLEIIKRSNKKVKRIFIETNFLLTKSNEDDKYLKSLFMPVLYTCRRYSDILLEKNQPFSVVGILFFSKLFSLVHISETPSKTNNTLNRQKASLKLSYSDSNSVKATVEDNIILLRAYYEYFKSSDNVEFVFYEMPIDCELVEEQVPIFCRDKINKFCLTNNIKQIPLPSCHDYKTSDGIHLEGKSRDEFNKFFFKETKDLITEK